jgi:hypothetical protein
MTSSSNGVRCTVQDGEVGMHVDDERIVIPSYLLTKSPLLVDALSAVDESSVNNEFTFPAPKEWLQAWIASYGNKRKRCRCEDIEELVNCLLVRICCWITAPIALKTP